MNVETATDTKIDLNDIGDVQRLILIIMIVFIIIMALLFIIALYRYYYHVNNLTTSVHLKTNDMKTLNKINRRQPIPPVPSFQSVDISRISSMPTSGFNERKTRTKSRFATLMCLFAKGPGKGKSKSNLPVPVQFSKFSLGSSTGFNINSARITVEPESESIRNNPTELKISRVPLTGPPKAKVKFLKEKSQPQKPTKSKLKPKVTTKSGFNMQKVKTISPKKVDPPKLVTKSNKSQRKLVKPKVEAKKSKAK